MSSPYTHVSPEQQMFLAIGSDGADRLLEPKFRDKEAEFLNVRHQQVPDDYVSSNVCVLNSD